MTKRRQAYFLEGTTVGATGSDGGGVLTWVAADLGELKFTMERMPFL